MSDAGGVGSPKRPNVISPRLSRTSVFYPNVVSAENNPHARKASDTTDISPMTSRAKLEAIDEPAQTVAPLPDVQALRDERPDSFASADFSRRGSAAEPAGSGMPPPETTFAFETEAADEIPESKQNQDRIQSTFLELPPQQHGALRSLQSPMPAGTRGRMSSMDNPVRQAVDPIARSVSPALFRSSFESESSIAESQVSATEGAEVIFQAAQQARLKRPSLVNQPAAGGSGLQLANLTKFIRDRDMQSSTEGELQDTFPENMSRSKSSIEASHNLRLSNIAAATSNFNRPGDVSTPPSTTRRFELSSIASPAEAMTLKDALRLNPVDIAAIPKRSATVPASLGAKHKTRFAPLSITSTGAGKFGRDSTVTTPYPKLTSTAGKNDEHGNRGQAPKPIDFNLTISFRSRNSTLSIPHFSSQENTTKAWWNAKEVDDERLVQLAKAEFRGLQGKVRHTMGAKTAKAVRMRFVRSNKIEYTGEPDTPLIGGRWGAYAESDFWRLWNEPSHGRSRRDWLEVLNDQTKTFGASRVFVLEVIEGYDPVRVIIAFSFITALSLVAMFLWMFLGTGGMSLNTNFSDIHGAIHVADSAISSTPGSPAAAFMFGLWILTLGWTGVGAWMLIS